MSGLPWPVAPDAGQPPAGGPDVRDGSGKVDLYFGPTLSLKYDVAPIAGTKFLGHVLNPATTF
jgi:hypothetical protein